MTRFLTYTRLRIKAAFRVLPALLLFMLLLCLSLLAVLHHFARTGAQTDQETLSVRLGIGIVGTDTSPYLDTGLTLIRNIDSSRSSVDFLSYASRREAVTDLENGALSAVIVIPDGLVDSLLSGGSGRLSLVLRSSNAGIGPLLIRELSDIISGIISHMKTSSDVTEAFLRAGGVEEIEQINEAQTELLLNALSAIMHRSELFQTEVVDAGLTLDPGSYYLIALLLLLLLLSGLLCAGCYIRDREELLQLLCLKGLTPARQILAEHISLFLVLGTVFALLLGPAAALLGHSGFEFAAFSDAGTPSVFLFLRFCLHLIPPALLACALDLLLFELSKSPLLGILILTLVMLSLAYLCGLFYPVSSLPVILEKIAPFLPAGPAFVFLQAAAAGKITAYALYLPAVLGYTLVLLGGTVLIRKKRLGMGGAV